MKKTKKQIREEEAQRAAQAQAARVARVRAALRWSEEAPVPDVPPPTYSQPFGTLTKGWLYNEHAKEVVRACSSSIAHSYGIDDRARSQGAQSLYSTRLLALRALRAALERQYAEQLAKIDQEIEQEIEKERGRDAG